MHDDAAEVAVVVRSSDGLSRVFMGKEHHLKLSLELDDTVPVEEILAGVALNHLDELYIFVDPD